MKRALALILSVLVVFVSLPLLSLSVSADTEKNVLYFNGNAGPLMTRVSVVPGGEYLLFFSLSNSVTNFEVKGFDNDSHSEIDIEAEEDDSYSVDGKYTRYTYFFIAPDDLETEQGKDTGLMFIGFTFSSGSRSGYIFDVELYDEDDNQIISNGDFSGGLNHWAWDWDAWFETWSTGKGLTEWSNSNVELRVTEYSDNLFKKMIHIVYSGYNDDSRFAKLVTLNKGHTYTFSFKYDLLEGGIGSSIRFNLARRSSNGVSGQCIGDAFGSGDDRYVPAVINEDTKTVTYTFTLQDSQWNNFTYPAQGEYGVGFLFKPNAANTDLYIGDVSIVDSTAPSVNLFGNDSYYETKMTDWCSTYAVSNAKTFTQTGYTATLLDYDVSRFTVSEHEIEEPGAPSKMIYYKNNSKTVLGNRFTGEAGKTYYLSFGIASLAGIDDIIIGAYGDGNRNSINVSPELVSKSERANYNWVTYSVTMPANLSSVADYNMVYIGPNVPANCETYLFNMNIYDPTKEAKTNLFNNKDFSTIVNTSIGDWTLIVRSPLNSSTVDGNDNKSVLTSSEGTEWYNTAGTKILKSVNYNASLFAGLKRMVYYKNGSKEVLGNRFTAEASKTYTLSFGIATSAEIDAVSIGAYGDGNRNSLNVSPTRLDKEDHGTYYYLTYSVTMPSNLSSVASYNMVYIGPKIPANCETYLFNMKIYDPADASQANKFSNKYFSDINTMSIGEWSLIVPSTAESNKTVLTESNNTEWYNTAQTKILRSISYDESLFAGLKNMLYFDITAAKPFYSRVSLVAGQSYNLEFSLTRNLKETDLSISAYQNGSRGNSISGVTKEFVSKTNCGKYATYNYRITMPSTLSLEDGKGFIGIKFPAGSRGYLFDVKLSKTDDADATQLFENGNFGAGLNSWSYEWDCWFISGQTGTGKTSWSNSNVAFNVKAFNVEDFDEVCTEQMLYFKESKKKGQEVFVQRINSLEANVEYTISMDYYFKSGRLDNTMGTYDSTKNNTLYFALYGGPGSNDSIYKTEYRASVSVSGGTLFSSVNDTGKNIKYTFTLTQAEIDKNTNYYAGFYLLPDPDMVTELYIHDFTLYRTSDTNKTNLFPDDIYTTTVKNWRSHYGNSYGEGSNTVFKRGSDIEFTAYYVPVVEDYFKYTDEIHYGDANADGVFDIRDLVNIKNRVSQSKPYFVMADADNNSTVTASDITFSRKVLLGKEDKDWEETEITFDTFNKSGGADSAANSRKTTINNYTDSISVTGTKYYVSSSTGSDSNTGRSTSSPFKTISKVNELGLKSGDAVLFKRGDTFRTASTISMVSGVTYSAYGSGAKPKIYGSIKNYADKSIWSTSDGNIWSTSLNATYADNAVFNNGESVGVRKSSLGDLKQNGDFYYNKSGKKFYLFLNQINPGTRFNSIEIASSEYLFHGWGSSTNKVTNAQIINLDLKYAAVHAIALGFVENITVQKCVIGWSGGGYQNGARLGNAIQLWRYAKTCNISDNYIYQAFDAAITFQGRLTNQYTNLTIQNNLIEYCSMNFEFFAYDENTGGVDSSAKMSNISFTGNVLRFGGMGFGGKQRDNIPDQAYILTWNLDYNNSQISSFSISNNTFDVANCNYYYSKNTQNYLTISNNKYYQADGSAFQFANASGDYVNNASELATAVAKVDSSANTVAWVD